MVDYNAVDRRDKVGMTACRSNMNAYVVITEVLEKHLKSVIFAISTVFVHSNKSTLTVP
jgi:hypothetical protein